MRFFGKRWVRASEATGRRILAAYNQFLESLQSPVGKQIRRFHNTYGLNDAYLDRLWFFSEERRIELTLVQGDLQVGYRHLVIEYRNARISGMSVKKLRSIIESREYEILYDEFDIEGSEDSDRYAHRFMLWPDYPVFSISFENFSTSERPLNKRRHMFAKRLFELNASTSS